MKIDIERVKALANREIETGKYGCYSVPGYVLDEAIAYCRLRMITKGTNAENSLAKRAAREACQRMTSHRGMPYNLKTVSDEYVRRHYDPENPSYFEDRYNSSVLADYGAPPNSEAV